MAIKSTNSNNTDFLSSSINDNNSVAFIVEDRLFYIDTACDGGYMTNVYPASALDECDSIEDISELDAFDGGWFDNDDCHFDDVIESIVDFKPDEFLLLLDA